MQKKEKNNVMIDFLDYNLSEEIKKIAEEQFNIKKIVNFDDLEIDKIVEPELTNKEIKQKAINIIKKIITIFENEEKSNCIVLLVDDMMNICFLYHLMLTANEEHIQNFLIIEPIYSNNTDGKFIQFREIK